MKNKRSLTDYAGLALRGMGMGAVDVIPGVSGGTIALITGIYQELINSIRSVNAGLLKTLAREGLPAAWKQLNGNFLAAVVGGILLSVFSLVRVLSWLFEHYAILVWAFFFGLIVGSALYVGRRIERWTLFSFLMLLFGTLLAYYITIATPATGPETLWFIFLSGAIAFCAMVLPGISGAFILVLLGSYEFMVHAVKDFRLGVIAVFGVGGVLGIIAFSNVIAWLFRKFPGATLALLTGFMIGSLNKLWPWKKVLESRISSSGEEVVVLERSISPAAYAAMGGDPMFWPVLISALAGLALMLVFMRPAKRH